VKIVRGRKKPPNTLYQVKMVSGQAKPLDMTMKEILKKIRLQSSSLDPFQILLTFPLTKRRILMMIVRLEVSTIIVNRMTFSLGDHFLPFDLACILFQLEVNTRAPLASTRGETTQCLSVPLNHFGI
jgi:hypothetical protein